MSGRKTAGLCRKTEYFTAAQCTHGSAERHAGGGGLQPDASRAAVSALRYYDFERFPVTLRTAH